MAKYHINLEGNPGRCSAKAGNCPFGSEEEHFASKADARRHYEETAEPTTTVFEVMQKRFGGSAISQSRSFAQRIDDGDEDFAKNEDGMAIQRMMLLARDLSVQQQKFIDKGIRGWYADRVSDLLSLNESFEDPELTKEDREAFEKKWRKVSDDLSSTYRDNFEDKIANNKDVMRYLAREMENYRKFTQAIDLMEVMTDRGYYTPRHGLYELKPNMNNYSQDDLMKLAGHSPVAASQFMEVYGANAIQEEKDKLYNLISDKEGDYSTGYLPRRREAIAKILEGSELHGGRPGEGYVQNNILLDASHKLNQANGISAKDFAKIMKKKLKNFEVKSSAERSVVTEIIDNIRNSKS